MAYLAQDEEEEKRQAAQVEPGAAPAGNAVTAPQSPTPKGSGFVNFQSYLAANDAGGMANRIASGVESEGAEARAGLDAASRTFGDAVKAGTVGYETRGSSAESRGGAAASYTGPASLASQDGFGGAVEKAAGAASKANALGTASGRSVLLQDAYGSNAGYTPGARSLDGALVGAQGSQAINQARDRVGDLRAYLGAAETNAASAVTGAQATSSDARAQYARDADAQAVAERTRANTQTAVKSKLEQDAMERRRAEEAKAARAREERNSPLRRLGRFLDPYNLP
jgi:hypothetical protein